MSYEKPTPPPDVPKEMADALDGHDPTTLRAVADYAESLAEHREREDRLREAEDRDDGTTERPDDLPDDVPAKAGITVKEINDNRYYYWQWREGERIRSKYKGPVDSE